MTKHRGLALTAGIMYLQFVIFAAAVLWLWLGESQLQVHVELLPTIPGAIELLLVIGVLMAASLIIGGWLTIRRTVNRIVLGAGVVIAAVAIFWNVLAVALWVAPLPFMWVSYKGTK